MYRVMIVDDELIIRRGIRNSIPWEEHDMELVGEAANGQEALDLADRLEPDIVIADICMPVMDGLEMSEKLLDRHQGIKVVILTGYDEFEYAQRACGLGISDFILKPTDVDELLSILDNVKKSISSERSIKIKMDELEQQLQNYMPIIRENYLVRLISGVHSAQDVYDDNMILDIQNGQGAFQVAVLDYDCMDQDSEFTGRMEMLHFAVKNICKGIVDEQGLGWTFYNTLGQVTILLHLQEKNAKLLFELMEKIQERVNKALKATFSIGVGRGYERVRDIKKSYEEAKEALEYRFIMGDNCILFIDDIGIGFRESNCNDLLKIEKDILKGIGKGNDDAVLLLLEKFFEKIRSQPNITPLWARAKCYELVSNLFLAFSDLGIPDVQLKDTPDKLYNEIHQSTSLGKVFSLVEGFVYDILGTVSQYRSNRTRKLIEMGKEYIENNFDKDISVSSVAEYLNVTPNYLSRLFKKETGEGCAEYISRVRIEKAKELLKTTLYLTYEIADMVGFKDANYFSLVFKKHTGMSPTEYRDSKIGEI